MAKGINKVILIGNLGADPEVRYMPSGGAVANVTIATSDQWKDKQTGERQERTEWHRVVFFGRLGEIVGEYLRKGSKVYVEGRLQTKKWQGQDGQDRYTTEIIANEMQMLDSRGEGTASYDSDRPAAAASDPQSPPQSPPPSSPPPASSSYDSSRPAAASGPQSPPPSAPSQAPAAASAAAMDDLDDDIPF